MKSLAATTMTDIIYTSVTIGFFVLSTLYALFCDTL